MFIFVTRVIITRNLKTMNNDLLLVSNKIKKDSQNILIRNKRRFLTTKNNEKTDYNNIYNFTSNGHHLQSDGHFYF